MVDPKRIQRWQQLMPRQTGLRRVALHWQGNLKHEAKLYSRGRSMPFGALLPLTSIQNMEFVVVQKGDGLEQLDPEAGFDFAPGQEHLSASMDFRDTAAVLKSCDLLISADSGVVHLAGALGVPTWVGLRWIPEWRWRLQGITTPWYDSLRLFRQAHDGDWTSVVAAMQQELQAEQR